MASSSERREEEEKERKKRRREESMWARWPPDVSPRLCNRTAEKARWALLCDIK